MTKRPQRPQNERSTPSRRRDWRNGGGEGRDDRDGGGDGGDGDDGGDRDGPEPNHRQNPRDESNASSSRPPTSQASPPSIPPRRDTLRRRLLNGISSVSPPEIRSVPHAGLRDTSNTPETLLLRPIPRQPTSTTLVSAPTVADTQTSHHDNGDSLRAVSNVSEQPSRPPPITPQTSGSAHNFVSNSSSQLEDVQSGLHPLSEELDVPHPIDCGPSVGVVIDISNTSSMHGVGDSDNSVTLSSVSVQRRDTPPIAESSTALLYDARNTMSRALTEPETVDRPHTSSPRPVSPELVSARPDVHDTHVSRTISPVPAIPAVLCNGFNALDVRENMLETFPGLSAAVQAEVKSVRVENAASSVFALPELQHGPVCNTANSTPKLRPQSILIGEGSGTSSSTPPVPETEERHSLHVPQSDVASHLIGITQNLEAVANIAQIEQARLHSGESTLITSPSLSTSSLPDYVSWPNSPGPSERSLDPELESMEGQRTPIQGSPSGTPINSPRALENPLPLGEQLPLSFENLEQHGLSTLQLSATLLTQGWDNGMMADVGLMMDRDETGDGSVSLDSGEDVCSEDSYDIVSNSIVRSASSNSNSSEDWEQISEESLVFLNCQ